MDGYGGEGLIKKEEAYTVLNVRMLQYSFLQILSQRFSPT